MKKPTIPVFLSCIFALLPVCTYGGDIIAPDAKVEKLADGFQFTEGPAADPEGNVYFTDQPNDRIMKWNIDGTVETFLQPSGRSNGLYFDNGFLYSCADDKNELWKINPTTKEVTVLIKEYEGKLLNGPNDLWIHPNGGIYFTDPFYKRTWWEHDTMPQDRQNVYFLTPDYKSIKKVDDNLVQPNGIIGTPDGRKLYVADIRDKKTYVYTINEDNTLRDRQLFCEMGSDGMTIDNQGNIYLTGNGVTVFNSQGEQIEHIAIDEPWTANITFGGSENNLLFITASKGIYGVQMKVTGAR
ncbi:MAG: SMP-30/gluconolactonase/LRE family protein [bacterium]|jgi:gluconolactonase